MGACSIILTIIGCALFAGSPALQDMSKKNGQWQVTEYDPSVGAPSKEWRNPWGECKEVNNGPQSCMDYDDIWPLVTNMNGRPYRDCDRTFQEIKDRLDLQVKCFKGSMGLAAVSCIIGFVSAIMQGVNRGRVMGGLAAVTVIFAIGALGTGAVTYGMAADYKWMYCGMDKYSTCSGLTSGTCKIYMGKGWAEGAASGACLIGGIVFVLFGSCCYRSPNPPNDNLNVPLQNANIQMGPPQPGYAQQPQGYPPPQQGQGYVVETTKTAPDV
jgi:hypothetical protein